MLGDCTSQCGFVKLQLGKAELIRLGCYAMWDVMCCAIHMHTKLEDGIQLCKWTPHYEKSMW